MSPYDLAIDLNNALDKKNIKNCQDTKKHQKLSGYKEFYYGFQAVNCLVQDISNDDTVDDLDCATDEMVLRLMVEICRCKTDIF